MVVFLHEGKLGHELFPHIYEIVLANQGIKYFQNLQTKNMWHLIIQGLTVKDKM
jgi:hypothetical protein